MATHTVLVVDDEAHIVHVVSLKLRNAGFDVITASDGEEGYELACEHLPSLIISDLQMPYLSGLEMCARLRENTSTTEIPVLLLTARGYSLEQEDLARTNIKTVLGKPFSPREVLEHVEQVLGRKDSTSVDQAA